MSNGSQQEELPGIPTAFDWEAMRADGYKAIDYIVDYHKSLSERAIPCQAEVKPNYLQNTLGTVWPEAPQTAQPFTDVLEDVKKHIEPGMTHWQHPDFYAFFPAMLSPPALLGDLLSNAFNQPGFNWVASPAATELEIMVTNWLVNAFGFSKDFLWSGSGGCVLQPSATEAAIVLMLAAKNRAVEGKDDIEKHNIFGRLVAYVSDQAHFCIEKAARVLSIPHFRKLKTHRSEVDGNYPLAADDLRSAIENDVANGLIPFFVSASYGATGVCAIDPVVDLSTVCKEKKLWLNVDAAYAGVTAICPELRDDLAAAAEVADSVFINGSKWCSMMFNCSFLFFRQKSHVVSSLNATGVYLSNPQTDQQQVVDFKDYHLGLGRPFRALKVYSSLRCLGVEGIQATVRRHIILAQYLHKRLEEDSRLWLPVATKFGLVSFTLAGPASPNHSKRCANLLHFLNDTRKKFIVHTVVEGHTMLRISLAHPGLTYSSMDELIQDISDGLAHITTDLIE
jgi:aromatic-L-amino-acid/L-tryptophan decarboxylase